jgi:tripartite-type tricarboxylate transporter receptor subunit TctC
MPMLLSLTRTVGCSAAMLLAALALGSLPAQAQSQSPSWPQRSVKLILPLGPGAGADIGARLFAERLSARWGQPVVVENRPGGDGFVAIGAFTSARDDHTLLFGPAAAFTAHPYLHEKLPYDPRELNPIARISITLVSVAVPPALNVNSLADVVKLARAQPGKFNWATITGATDLVFAGFLKSAGLDMAKVPYRDPVQALNDLADSRIHVYVSALAIVRAQMQAGRVKVIAITNNERAAVLPNVPTVAEAGFPALAFDGLVGLYGPRDMPLELRERIAADIRAVAADPAIADRLSATGQVVSPGTPGELAHSIEQQRAGVAATAQLLGIKPAQ